MAEEADLSLLLDDSEFDLEFEEREKFLRGEEGKYGSRLFDFGFYSLLEVAAMSAGKDAQGNEAFLADLQIRAAELYSGEFEEESAKGDDAFSRTNSFFQRERKNLLEKVRARPHPDVPYYESAPENYPEESAEVVQVFSAYEDIIFSLVADGDFYSAAKFAERMQDRDLRDISHWDKRGNLREIASKLYMITMYSDAAKGDFHGAADAAYAVVHSGGSKGRGAYDRDDNPREKEIFEDFFRYCLLGNYGNERWIDRSAPSRMKRIVPAEKRLEFAREALAYHQSLDEREEGAIRACRDIIAKYS